MEQGELHQFVATARQLFEAAPGSPAQRAANEWLMGFQLSADAWRVALQVLQRSSEDKNVDPPTEQSIPPAVLTVTMQLLRLKIVHGWNETTHEQRAVVRETLLQWLHDTSATVRMAMTTDTAPAVRVGCAIVADLVVKMHAHEWPRWQQELQRQLRSTHHTTTGIFMLLEIYGAIPIQCQAATGVQSEETKRQVTTLFQSHVAEIVRVACIGLTVDGLHVRESALRCIENWRIGCISDCPEVGIDATLLLQSSLLSTLMQMICNGEEHIAQAAGEIVADILTGTPSDPLFLSPTLVTAVVQTVAHLHSCRHLLHIETRQGAAAVDDTVVTRCKSMSRIASVLALHHAVSVFSSDGQQLYVSQQQTVSGSTSSPPPQLAVLFLELLLACTSFPDADVAQPTLEFWFFLLDKSTHQGVQLALLSSSLSLEQLVSILSHVVNALIDRCRYPQYVVESQMLPSFSSNDDEDVEKISSLRKEIADTLLSLFTKWPTSPPNDQGASCVKGMAALLRSSTDIATLDAVLYLLEYTVELFDIESSASESDDEEEGEEGLRSQSAHEGAQLLQQILLDALELPAHPLLIRGITRFVQSVSKSLVLPGEVYIRVAQSLCRGLEMETSFSLTTHAVRSLSKSIVQYTDIDDRQELLTTLATKCQRLPSSSSLSATATASVGDLLEASFRITHGLSDADFTSFCNAVLSTLTQQVASQDLQTAATSVTLLGRAIGGIDDAELSRALGDQVWPLVAAAINSDTHGHSAMLRESVLQYFCSAIVANASTPLERLCDVVQYCLQWLPHTTSASTLQCLAAIISNPMTHQQADKFAGIVDRLVETTVSVCARRLQFDPANDDAQNHQRMDALFANEQATVQLTPEIIELVALLRLVVRHFPAALVRSAATTASFASTPFVTMLRLSWLLLDVDHQVQEICDAVCDLLLDVCSSQPLWSCSPHVPDALAAISAPVLRAVLAFFGPKRVHYQQRSLWNFLFQLLHAPRVAAPLKVHFHATLTKLLVEERVLTPPLSLEQSGALALALTSTTQRHRFVALLTSTATSIMS